jgi:hypothetical protein
VELQVAGVIRKQEAQAKLEAAITRKKLADLVAMV